MTSARGTGLLILIAAALLTYIVFFERHLPDSQVLEQQSQRLFPELEPANVTAVTLVLSNGTVRVEREGDSWRLVQPSYPALDGLINEWLTSLASLTRGGHLTSQELLHQPGARVALGLEPPRATITIEQGPRRFQFLVGAKVPLGNKIYLQKVAAEGVDLADAAVFDRLPAQPTAWRDRAFVQLMGRDFDRVQMRGGGREYELHRESPSSPWRLVRPRVARADQAKVESMLQELRSIEVTQFVSDVDTLDLEPFGLQLPQASFTFFNGSNAVWGFDLGHALTNHSGALYARRTGPSGIVTVPRAALELVAVPAGALLDLRLIDLPVESVTRVEVKAQEDFAVEKRPEGWLVLGPAELKGDPGLMATFLGRLQSLRIAEVAKEVVTELDLPTYGLAPPSREYTLVAGNSNAPATGPNQRIDLGNEQDGRVFARRADEASVYTVRAEEVVWLPTAAFQLRDRRIWLFETNQVQSVTIDAKGYQWKLEKNPGGRWALAPGSQGIVNTFALEEAIFRMGSLRAVLWVSQEESALQQYGITEMNHRLHLEVMRNGTAETLTVAFGAPSPSGGPYAATTLDGKLIVFEFPLDVFQPYRDAAQMLVPGSNPG